MNLIRTESLSVSLDGVTILDDVSFSLAKGEIVGLVGPNGAGKTTVLKTLMGLLKAERGSVEVFGKPLGSFSRREIARKLGYLPQETEIHWPLVVERIVALGRVPYLMPWEDLGEDDERIIADAMRATDTLPLRKRRVDRLAGGEKALVMIARLLAGEPEILLADEPVQGLDPSHSLQVMEFLRNVAGNGRGVLVVLHDLALASRFCHRILLLHGGKLMASGRPEEVFSPANLKTSYHIEAKYGNGDGFYVVPWRRIAGGSDHAKK
ncbi:MAG TPA: ABC transporter ATP-binding protein [Candidatus Omnitrophota bacterium]|jgi:iron complex transport system ATP-binding protein|nr:ABC transporter ATP-binding protein [Candidatus Omnitrophota bacterium]HQB93880.1 ABC transporter ATP-binding protein [Candidatus Omnitrophota bacterium]